MKSPSPNFFVTLLFIGFMSVAHTQIVTPDPANTTNYIEEVYDYAVSDLGYDTPERMELFAANLARVEIYQTQELPAKYRLLSEIPVITLYNPALKPDFPFEPGKFNPLKYKFDFFSNEIVYYLVDSTNYLIVIKPH